MSLRKGLNIWTTLAFRLTLWYGMIFTVSSFVVFLSFYIMMSSAAQNRMDRELLEDLSEISSIMEKKGLNSMETEMKIEAESEGVEKTFLRLLDLKGKVLVSSDMSSWNGIGVARTALKKTLNGTGRVFETLSLKGRKYQARILYGAVGPNTILQIGKSLDEDARLLEAFRKFFGTTMIIVVVISALIGWFMARRALSGVEEVTQTAMDISKGDFGRRVPAGKGGDEIMRLANAFNLMLDRIHELMAGMKEMTDHIAHDLKTPVTRIRGLAEFELNSEHTSGKSQELAADTIEECDQLLQMINTLLEITETEAGVVAPLKDSIDIADVVRNLYELFRPIADEKGISLLAEGPDHLYVTGDIHGFQRMIVNLLENAVKYTPAGGTVTVSFRGENGQIIIAFLDTGIGISEEDLPHIFKRLYRCEPSRSQPGFGLGLSLAYAVARAHGGDIRVLSRPGEGSLFEVSLPVPASES